MTDKKARIPQDDDSFMIIVGVGSSISSSIGDAIEHKEEEEKFEEDNNCNLYDNICCEKHVIPFAGTVLSLPLFIIGCYIGIIPSLEDDSDEEREEKGNRGLYALSGLCIISALLLLSGNLFLLVQGKWIYLTARRLYFDLHVVLILFMIVLPCIFFFVG